jgi:hypothetical protein
MVAPSQLVGKQTQQDHSQDKSLRYSLKNKLKAKREWGGGGGGGLA